MTNAERFAVLVNIIFILSMIGWLIIEPTSALIFIACYVAFDVVAALIITVAKMNAQYQLRPINGTCIRVEE